MTDSNPKSKVKVQIDENLKRIYDETLKEEIPDRLMQLLRQLQDKTSANATDEDREGS